MWVLIVFDQRNFFLFRFVLFVLNYFWWINPFIIIFVTLLSMIYLQFCTACEKVHEMYTVE